MTPTKIGEKTTTKEKQMKSEIIGQGSEISLSKNKKVDHTQHLNFGLEVNQGVFK